MPVNEYTSKVDFAVKPDGPKLALNDVGKVESYDRSDVELGPKEPKRRVDIQPSGKNSQLRFLIIQRSPAAPNAERPKPKELEYQVNGKGKWIPLENYHALLGAGVDLLLAENEPSHLVFLNHTNTPISVTILVGRDWLAPEEASQSGEEGQSGQQSEKSQYSSM